MNTIDTTTTIAALRTAIAATYGDDAVAKLTPFMGELVVPEELVYTSSDLEAAKLWVNSSRELFPELADNLEACIAFQAIPVMDAELAAVAALAGGVLGQLSVVETEKFKAFFESMDAYRSSHEEIIEITEKGEKIKEIISPIFFSKDGAFTMFCELVSRGPSSFH